MSHYVNFKTQITDVTALVRALKRCHTKIGRKWTENDIEVYGTAANLYGYTGDKRNDKANVIIRRKNVQASANDIGFVREKDGTYSAIISDFDQGTGEYAHGSHGFYGKDWQEELIQFYNLEKAKMLCDENDLEYEESVEQGDPVLLAKFKVDNDPEKLTVDL